MQLLRLHEHGARLSFSQSLTPKDLPMRYLALAVDYDNTIATGGTIGDAALEALERLRTSGRRATLLTGRPPDDLLAPCPRINLFYYVLADAQYDVLIVPDKGQVR